MAAADQKSGCPVLYILLIDLLDELTLTSLRDQLMHACGLVAASQRGLEKPHVGLFAITGEQRPSCMKVSMLDFKLHAKSMAIPL